MLELKNVKLLNNTKHINHYKRKKAPGWSVANNRKKAGNAFSVGSAIGLSIIFYIMFCDVIFFPICSRCYIFHNFNISDIFIYL